MSQQVARNVTESMLDVASHSEIGLSGGRPVAAKTGTVQSSTEGQNNDAWTVGYTPQLSTAVWVGTDDNSPIKTSAGKPIYGRGVPGQIWQRFMNSALRDDPVEKFSDFKAIGAPPAPPPRRSRPEQAGRPGGPVLRRRRLRELRRRQQTATTAARGQRRATTATTAARTTGTTAATTATDGNNGRRR